MVVRVTVDLYSGAKNPSIDLTADEAREIMPMLKPADGSGAALKYPSVSTLGYRGLLIEQSPVEVPELPPAFRLANGDIFAKGFERRAGDPSVEEFICGSTGPLRRLGLGDGFSRILIDRIARFKALRVAFPTVPTSRLSCIQQFTACLCAPPYEPGLWSIDLPPIRETNNCYNYATNRRTDTRATPGLAANFQLSQYSCAETTLAVMADGLTKNAFGRRWCPPPQGHLVALLIDPNAPGVGDFHFLRKDRNGYWSQKRGADPPTNRDLSFNLITDPEAQAPALFPYTEFCGYFVAHHGKFNIW